ncbi:MAG TPA: MarR family transcriptional regulator [Candidatus Dormibacteraeota bacterium]|jgi:DNA-binding MarR family transcriptional regulator|nr:MarR family transcriptional regulator [Candidatus Dormibacteraeota bacterium]
MSTPPRWLDDEEQQAWRAFVSAGRLLIDRLDRELQSSAGMPMTYYEVLVQLSEAPGRSLRMSELARRSLSSPSRLSHAVARLEELGWVRRQACPSDRRGAFAVLTDEGFAAIEAAAPGHVEGIRNHLLDQLSPEQVGQLRQIGEALSRHLLPGAEPAECTEEHGGC